MATTRRGFLGILGAAAAATAAVTATGGAAGLQRGKARNVTGHMKYINELPVEVSTDQLYTELYASRVVISIVPMRGERVRQITTVYLAPKTPHSSDADFVGVAEGSIPAGAECSVQRTPRGVLITSFGKEDFLGNHTETNRLRR